ncbi:hypothetical protein, partial [Acinetobacter indicus]|uniref:hypothetical protein n=1 Tax=Acinetobacter indicus TaxID=756892 RepID=UPI001C09D1B9
STILAKSLFINKFLSTSPPMDVHYRPNILPCKAFCKRNISSVYFINPKTDKPLFYLINLF